jgi:lipoprotein-releasing system permease protein
MYKLLLCWRYLKTRYLAFVCIVSVMLGVATLIVVNSVMSGFSTKLRERLHGLLSDVVVESQNYSGFPKPTDQLLADMKRVPSWQHVEAVSPTIEVFALMSYRQWNGAPMTHVVRVIGVDAKSRARVGGFAEHLVDPRRRERPSFDLTLEAFRRFRMNHPAPPELVEPPPPLVPGQPPPPDPTPETPPRVEPKGLIVGYAIATRRHKRPDGTVKDVVVLPPGEDVSLTTFDATTQRAIPIQGVVVDYFKSEMNEYDANYVYVPLDHLQRLMAWENRVTSVQIKLTDYRHAAQLVADLRALLPVEEYKVQTWEDKQGPLLSAIAVERGILNVLLFLIVGVAGFGILAIFSMIVMEKTRDIGVLKSLGASSRGVMAIFLLYGLLLGVVGAGLGTVLGLVITDNINEIEKALASLTGQDVFPRDVYYFDKIPTNVSAGSVVLVNLGAILIAVVFSILPAVRAAMLHPVRALRYE